MEITQDIINDFRNLNAPFADTCEWPRDIVESALCEAQDETKSCRWGEYGQCNQKQRGLFLYAAHALISTYPLGASDESAQDASTKSLVSSKSVGDESVNYASSGEMGSGNQWLASTAYGQRFMRLRRRVGMGAVAC